MTPEELTVICESIYGKTGWQTKLARDLVREPRTIRRWRAGKSPIPQKVQEWLLSRTIRREVNNN